MKVKISATYDGGEVEVTAEMTKGESMKSSITGSGEPNTELETIMLASAYQIWEVWKRLEVSK